MDDIDDDWECFLQNDGTEYNSRSNLSKSHSNIPDKNNDENDSMINNIDDSYVDKNSDLNNVSNIPKCSDLYISTMINGLVTVKHGYVSGQAPLSS